MKIIIYCKICPDGLGDFGHFKKEDKDTYSLLPSDKLWKLKILKEQVDKTPLASFLTPTFKSHCEKIAIHLNQYFDVNPRLDFYLLLFFKKLTSNVKKIKPRYTNAYQLAAMFFLLPEEERYAFLISSESLKWDDKLVQIFIYFLPPAKRWDFYVEKKSQIKKRYLRNILCNPCFRRVFSFIFRQF